MHESPEDREPNYESSRQNYGTPYTLQSPRGVLFLMSEVTLYDRAADTHRPGVLR